jgi:DnaJ-class molecular chaperone
MNDTIRITCPACNGGGVRGKRHPSGDPQLDTMTLCEECDGTATREVTV